jgi:transcriptional regulator with XRE-family HTH domain
MPFQIGRSRLPELLDAKRMSQADFARRLDVTEGYISKLISLDSKFSIIKAKEAAHILGCYIDELYEWNYIR